MLPLDQNKIIPFDAVINLIKDNDANGKNVCLFLGAGCSISSNVKKAGEIIDYCKKIAYVKIARGGSIVQNKFDESELDAFIDERREDFERFVIEKQEMFSKNNSLNRASLCNTIPQNLREGNDLVGLWDVYESNFFNDSLYGNWFELFSENIDDRQRLIEYLIDDKNPRGAYIFLAYLIKQGVFKNIFTTNFDDFLNEALIHYANIKSKVYAHNEIAKYIDFTGKKPNIIKLHGDYLFQNIKNTLNETTVLAENMNEKLSDALLKFKMNVIVIGYNGADHSVMKCLHDAKSKYPFGLFWCGRSVENLHWRAANLINSTSNSYFIKISGFEAFIAKIYSEMGENKEEEKLIEILAAKRSDERIIFIKEYLEDINQDIDLKEAEKVKIKETLEVRLTERSFIDVYSLPDIKSQVEYLSELRIDGISRILKNIYSNLDKSVAHNLFVALDSGDFFSSKISKAPIQHIGNALCNLNKIDDFRTKKIFLAVPDKIIIDKFKTATAGEIMSALNEMMSIDSVKATCIGKFVPTSAYADIENVSLREFTKSFTKANRHSAIEKFNSYSDEVYRNKMLKESAKEMAIAFEKFHDISPVKATSIFEGISNEEFIEKLTNSTFLQLSNALNKFTFISKNKTKIIYKAIPDFVLIKKIENSSLRDISISFSELSNIDRDKTHRIYMETSDTIFANKIKESEFIQIAHSLRKLNNLNYKKTEFVLRKTTPAIFTARLNDDISKFEEIGAALLNVFSINKTLFTKVVHESKIIENAKRYALDCSGMGHQAFMTYYPNCIDIHKGLTIEILKNLPSDFFIELMKWPTLDAYSTSLWRVYELLVELKMSQNAKIVASFLCYNQDKLLSKYNDAEIMIMKRKISEYYDCK